MSMRMWCLMSVLGASLLGASCNIAGTSGQEDLGRGIVRGHVGSPVGRRCAVPHSSKHLCVKRTGDGGRGWGLCASGRQWRRTSCGA